jgi:hypothetical protein
MILILSWFIGEILPVEIFMMIEMLTVAILTMVIVLVVVIV